MDRTGKFLNDKCCLEPIFMNILHYLPKLINTARTSIQGSFVNKS